MRKLKMKSIMKNKRAVSELVSYVLLIGLALAMSSVVYGWLKFRAEKPFAEESCSDALSLIMASYDCNIPGQTNMINITVQNKGSFYIYGYSIKSSNEETGIAGKSAFDLWINEVGKQAGDNIVSFSPPLKGSEKNSKLFIYNPPIRQIEIEPFILKEGENVYCENAIVTSKVDC